VHALGAKRHGNISLRIHSNKPALPAQFLYSSVDYFFGRLFETQPFVFNQGGNIIGRQSADEKFSVAGAGDCTGVILAYVPAPIIGLSPIRPQALLVSPPVEVAEAIFPLPSTGTAPTVPNLWPLWDEWSSFTSPLPLSFCHWLYRSWVSK
jgi:hypothetical protein